MQQLNYQNTERNSEDKDVSTEVVAVVEENFWCVITLCAQDVVCVDTLSFDQSCHAQVNHLHLHLQSTEH